MGFLNKWRVAGRSPLAGIEVIIALAAIVGGLYLLSPFLSLGAVGASPSALAKAATAIGAIWAVAFVAISSGVMIIVGIVKRNFHLRSAGLFIQIMLRLYALLITWLTVGLFPMDWLSSFVVLGITVVCWVVVRGMLPRKVAKRYDN